MNTLKKGLFALAACHLLANTYAYAGVEQDFAKKMSQKHKLDQQEISSLLAQAVKQQSILDAISRPAEGMPWQRYRKIFMTEKRISAGVQFWSDNQALLAKASAQFGVPEQIIVAIIGVETNFGNNMGSYRVLDALYTLGFHYPKRSAFFSQELEHFILMSKEQQLDPLSIKGSYAGAMGFGQFIPSSYRNFAIDFDQDGKADLLNNKADAIGSVANYFAKHGWKKGEQVASPATLHGNAYKQLMHASLQPKFSVADYAVAGVSSGIDQSSTAKARLLELDSEDGNEYWMTLNNFYVITRYNHSPLYAMAVYQLSQAIQQEYQQTVATNHAN